VTSWPGPAMGSVDDKDLDETPVATASTDETLVTNTAHLARLLKGSACPPS
jgi:hypothetical protein